MASSDSDIEMIEILPGPVPALLVSEDELLDIDDYVPISKKKKSKTGDRRDRKTSKATNSRPTKNTFNAGNRRDKDGSDIEVIEDDKISLLSLSPPSPSPCSSQNVRGVQSSLGAMRFSSQSQSDESSSVKNKTKTKKPSHKTNQSSSSLPKPSPPQSNSADITCTYGKDEQEVDNFFKEAGYGSLADYIADAEAEQRAMAKVDHSTSHETLFKSTSSSKPPVSKPGPKSKKGSGDGSLVVKERSKRITKPTAQNKPPPGQNAVNPPMQKKPDNILKVMTLKISKDVISDALASELLEREVQFEIVDNSPANSVQFERNTRYKMVEKDLNVKDCVLTEMDENIIIIFDLEKRLELFEAELDNSSGSQTLSDWIKKLLQSNTGKLFTFVIHGLEAYLKKIQRRVQNEFRNQIRNADNAAAGKRKRKENKPLIQLSRSDTPKETEIQGILIGIQLETGINYRFYENVKDLALHLFQYTKSIGEAPSKLAKMNSTEFDWYAVSDSVGGIPVEDDGKGMRSLWISQIAQFPSIGQDIAMAIVRKYGSPKELYQAYRRCNTVEEGKQLLANIMLTVGMGPLAKTRKVGPEASKKIYRFFISRDGEQYINH